ncbi:hypothetical protein D3C79_715340 [compost metagenome]
MSATGLTAIADAQGQQLALPLKIRTMQLDRSGTQLAEARQPGEQVGRGAQNLFQVFGGIGGHLAAETTGSHVQKHLPTDLAQIDGLRRHFKQGQGLPRLQRHPGCPGKVVGRAQRQQHQAGSAIGTRHGLGDVAQRAITASGHQVRVAGCQCLLDQALGITSFPGQAHVQLPATLTQGSHRSPNRFIHGLFAMQDHQCLLLRHLCVPR